jgi:ATP phosphoribosyltransferase regulatory subunit HisZ
VKIIKNTTLRFSIIGRYFVVFAILFSTISFALIPDKNTASADNIHYYNYNFNSPETKTYIPKPEREVYIEAQVNLNQYQEEQAKAEARRKELEEKVNRTLNYLRRVKSPVANEEIATIIVDLADQNNADYRVLLAIMTIESGSCRQSFSYNCFGYLNGRKYPSFEVAFKDLVPKVSRQYAAKYGWDFVALSRAYGQHNWELHSKNMLKVASSI